MPQCALAFLMWICAAAAQQHVVFLDAGSTGTRLYVYRYDNKVVGIDFFAQKPMIAEMVKIVGPTGSGVSSNKPLADLTSGDAVKDYLKPFVDGAKNVTTGFDNSKIPIFLYATAGVRLLKAAARIQLMKWVRDAFSDSTVSPYFFKADHALVISGEQEAIYTFAAANMLLQADPASATVEIGGASAQITIPSTPESFPIEEYFELVMQNKRIPNYATSFLKFGGIEAFKTYNASIDKNATMTTCPCTFTGNTNGAKAGKGDYDECRKLIKETVFDPVRPVASLYGDETSIAGVYLPDIPDTNTLMLLGGTAFFALENASCITKVKQSCLQTGGVEMCKKSWNDISNNGANPRAWNFCFNIAYTAEFLSQMRVNAEREFYVKSSINSTSVSWTLGATAYRMGLWDPPAPVCKSALRTTVAAITFAAVLLMALVLA